MDPLPLVSVSTNLVFTAGFVAGDIVVDRRRAGVGDGAIRSRARTGAGNRRLELIGAGHRTGAADLLVADHELVVADTEIDHRALADARAGHRLRRDTGALRRGQRRADRTARPRPLASHRSRRTPAHCSAPRRVEATPSSASTPAARLTQLHRPPSAMRSRCALAVRRTRPRLTSLPFQPARYRLADIRIRLRHSMLADMRVLA